MSPRQPITSCHNGTHMLIPELLSTEASLHIKCQRWRGIPLSGTTSTHETDRMEEEEELSPREYCTCGSPSGNASQAKEGWRLSAEMQSHTNTSVGDMRCD